MFPKVNPLHAPGRRKTLKADYKVIRPKVRQDTYLRDGMRCRACGRWMPLKGDTPLHYMHIHETESPRAEAAIDITLRSTISLDPECHAAVELYSLRLTYMDDVLRCNGPVEFTGRLGNGRILTEPYVSQPTLTGAWRIAE